MTQLEPDEDAEFAAALRQRGLARDDVEVIVEPLTIASPATLSGDQPAWITAVVVRSRSTGSEGRYNRGSVPGSWITDFARDLDALAFWPHPPS